MTLLSVIPGLVKEDLLPEATWATNQTPVSTPKTKEKNSPMKPKAKRH